MIPILAHLDHKDHLQLHHHNLNLELQTNTKEDVTDDYNPVKGKLDRAAECMQYYQRKVKEQETVIKKQKTLIKEQKEDFAQSIHRIRDFWKNKIYHEHSRSGKIVKMSMQNATY